MPGIKVTPADGRELVRWMEENGWSVSALAERLGVGERTLYTWRKQQTFHPRWLRYAQRGLGRRRQRRKKGGKATGASGAERP